MNSTSENSKNSPPLYILFGGLFLGYRMSGNSSPAKPPEISGTILPHGRIIAPFKLIDHENREFGVEQLKNQWTFLFFGYTHCPDVCPTTMFQFNLIANTLKNSPNILANTRFALVSVDPERDTPEVLSKYLAYYNKDFIGLTGNLDEISKFTRGLGIVFGKDQQEPGEDNYLVDHSAAVLLTNNKGHLYTIFSPPHDAARIARDYIKARHYYERLK